MPGMTELLTGTEIGSNVNLADRRRNQQAIIAAIIGTVLVVIGVKNGAQAIPRHVAEDKTVLDVATTLKHNDGVRGVVCRGISNPLLMFYDGRKICPNFGAVRTEQVLGNEGRHNVQLVVPLTSERKAGFLPVDWTTTIAGDGKGMAKCMVIKQAARSEVAQMIGDVPGVPNDEYVPFRLVFNADGTTICDDPQMLNGVTQPSVSSKK